MSRAAPSPQTLQHLARLCRATSSTSTISPATCRSTLQSRSYAICTRNQSESSTVARAANAGSIRTPQTYQHQRLQKQKQQQQRNITQSSILSSQTPLTPNTTNTTTDTSTSDSPISAPLPDITNYYTLFPQTLPDGPPPTGPFTIPLPSLKREFLHLQSQFHPDKFPPGTQAHTKSLALSSLINTAYKTLSSPLLRAQYLLHQTYGVDVTTEDNSAFKTDPETLMEVMEAQETIQDASCEEEIVVVREENQSRIEETVARLESAFEGDDREGATDETVRLKYWTSLQEVLHHWQPGKEIRLVH